jgi:hypothetical protein
VFKVISILLEQYTEIHTIILYNTEILPAIFYSLPKESRLLVEEKLFSLQNIIKLHLLINLGFIKLFGQLSLHTFQRRAQKYALPQTKSQAYLHIKHTNTAELQTKCIFIMTYSQIILLIVLI